MTPRERALEDALKRADRLCKEALPKFNWGASALDANAIRLLNEVPTEIARALAHRDPRALPELKACPLNEGNE